MIAGNRALSTRIIILGLVGVVAVFFAGFAISRGSLRQQSIDREELLHQKREANLTLELKRLDVAKDSSSAVPRVVRALSQESHSVASAENRSPGPQRPSPRQTHAVTPRST